MFAVLPKTSTRASARPFFTNCHVWIISPFNFMPWVGKGSCYRNCFKHSFFYSPFFSEASQCFDEYLKTYEWYKETRFPPLNGNSELCDKEYGTVSWLDVLSRVKGLRPASCGRGLVWKGRAMGTFPCRRTSKTSRCHWATRKVSVANWSRPSNHLFYFWLRDWAQREQGCGAGPRMA